MNARLASWLALSALVVVVDQATKWLVLQTLADRAPIQVTDFFRLVLVYNPGAAFSFLADQPGWRG